MHRDASVGLKKQTKSAWKTHPADFTWNTCERNRKALFST